MLKRKTLVVVCLVTTLFVSGALPAWATVEQGSKNCSTNAHVYTKGYWKTSWNSWLDITADGTREKTGNDTNSGTWETDYINTWASVPEHGPVFTNINTAFYRIFGTTLDTVASWPGCQTDSN